ncbi:MAG: hypothetical protein HW380_1045 [Magnetococcales bacterium]|nr:hypothetical protein [Magnetococcales bacterium]HIJ84870.1 hypothetical protein [Magnetococcales bacterium]
MADLGMLFERITAAREILGLGGEFWASGGGLKADRVAQKDRHAVGGQR